MRVLLYASLAGVLIVGNTGCLTVSAKTPPALNMPEPPSRVVTPPSAPVEPPPPTPAPTTTAPAPPATGTGTAAPPTTPVRPPPNTNPPATTSPPAEPPVLQTTSDTVFLERKIQEHLDNAKRDLDRVDKRQLSKDALAQYNWAWQLYRAADDARKTKNFSLAYQQSEKAALMAALLVKFISPTSL